MSQLLNDLSLNTLRTAYRTGIITPVQVIELIYERIAKVTHNPIWITLRSPDEVIAEMQALAQYAAPELPLLGIPFAVKDNIDVKGLPTTAACPSFSYSPDRHAAVVARLVAAGAVVIGKTNLDQFATGLVGTRSPYGACQNAYDPEYISGGSSSGSAIAVAKGLVSFALGTDTAGSGRVPAGFNNIVGLKPTRGLISTTGVVPACRSLDCVSIFALNTSDAAEILAIAAAHDPSDGYSRSRPDQISANSPTKGFRFGVPNQLSFFGDREYEKLYDQSLTRLQKMGGTAVEIDYSPFHATAQLLYSGAWVVERYTALKDFLATHSHQVLPVLATILAGSLKYTASDVFLGFYRLAELQQQARLELQKVDVLAVPTAGTIYKIAEIAANPLDLNTNLGYYTNFVNLLDLAAIALPSGFRNDALPFGLTLIAPAFAESYLCELGKQFEQI